MPLTARLEDLAELVDSMGGHELWTKFEREKGRMIEKVSRVMTKVHGEAFTTDMVPLTEAHFFNLQGNVRTLQAQVRRYQVLGKL